MNRAQCPDRLRLNSQTTETAGAAAGLNVACSFRDARLVRGQLMLIEARLDLRGRRGGNERCFLGGLH